MPYAIKFTSKKTGEVGVGPILYKKIEIKNKPVKTRAMTRKEAEKVADMANINPTFENAIHVVVDM